MARSALLAAAAAAALASAAQPEGGGMTARLDVLSIACFSADSLENVYLIDSAATAQYNLALRHSPAGVRDGARQVRKLPPVIPGVEVFTGSGWFDGGHQFLPSATIARQGKLVAVVDAVREGPGYVAATAFSGNTRQPIEPKRHKPDLDLTPAILGHLERLRESDSLTPGALVELTYLLVVMYHSEPTVQFIIRGDDSAGPKMRALAGTRRWSVRTFDWLTWPPRSPSLAGPADQAPGSELRPFVVSIGDKRLRMQCSAQVTTATGTRLESIEFESDYASLRLTSRTAAQKMRVIR